MEHDSVVIGRGMVGQATMKSLGINRFYSRSERNIEISDIIKHKYIYICVPTPTNDYGRQDIGKIATYINMVGESPGQGEGKFIIIRSTVLPGTCKKLSSWTKAKIVHVPEFLTEETWEKDADWPDVIVIGADDDKARHEIEGIFKHRFKGAEYFVTDLKTAEMTKYAVNTFYAMKIVFANQIFDYCQDNGINYETVKNAMYARKWVGRNHLDIWHKGGRGAAGKCLKKDLDAFATQSSLPVLEFINKINRGLVLSYPKHG